MKHRTVKRHGKRYVVIDQADFAELTKSQDVDDLPEFPPVDENGNSPAIEYSRVSIARQLITDRKAAGLTQAELARRAGIRAETLNRLEKAKHSADEATIKLIERVLKTYPRTKKESGGRTVATVKIGDVEVEHNYATRTTRTFIPVALAKDHPLIKRA
jgi:transcriptional regulator with XRE-family HTH domain